MVWIFGCFFFFWVHLYSTKDCGAGVYLQATWILPIFPWFLIFLLDLEVERYHSWSLLQLIWWVDSIRFFFFFVYLISPRMILLLRFIAHNSAVGKVLVISPHVKFVLWLNQVPKSSTLCWTRCFTSNRCPLICSNNIEALVCSRCYLFCYRGKGKFPYLEKDMQRGSYGSVLLLLSAHRGKIVFHPKHLNQACRQCPVKESFASER